MTDLSVVMKVLHSYETADELALFFRDYGIKAQPRNGRACPIAQFVVKETGLPGVLINICSVVIENDWGEQLDTYSHTDAMVDFVEMYDRGYYPDLIEEGYELPYENYNCCPDCG